MVMFVFAVGNSGIRFTWTYEEELPLYKEEVIEYFALLLFGGGHDLQVLEGFLHQGT